MSVYGLVPFLLRHICSNIVFFLAANTIQVNSVIIQVMNGDAKQLGCLWFCYLFFLSFLVETLHCLDEY